jgi:LacI family transcriptional regulator
MPSPLLKPPKYTVLAEKIRAQIHNGALKPRDRLPTFVELSAESRVTPTTVGRAYAALESENLIVRERGRGTFVRSLQALEPTGIIGIGGMTAAVQAHPYWMQVTEGVNDVAQAAGYELLLLAEDSELSRERMDGAISFWLRDGKMPPLPPGMPYVALLDPAQGGVNVLADEYDGALSVTRHLLGLGHRHIAYLFDPYFEPRRKGYGDALREAGIKAEAGWLRSLQIDEVRANDYMRLGHEAMKQWLSDGWAELGCTALMAYNDDAAIGAIRALRQAGFSVPGQVSVTGFDGTELGRYFEPPLTTVEVPLHDLGATAMELLLRQIRGEEMRPCTVSLPTRVIDGESAREYSER